MDNNFSSFGFTLQKCICEKYGIVPNSERAITTFSVAYDPALKHKCLALAKKIFDKIGLKPVECTTFEKTNKGKDVFFNFILEDNSSVSIRTNIKGDKVAPRNVGQAGYKKMNEYFGRIYGAPIESQIDIKKLICYHIAEILPIFLDNLFDADYIVWVNQKDGDFDCEVIRGDTYADLDFDKSNFSFTRSFTDWAESNTIKYKNKSIAEAQIHKNRTFKFRFSMENLLPYVKEKEINNETLGITAEKVICDIFNLEFPKKYNHRASIVYEEKLKPLIAGIFEKIPTPMQYTGNKVGLRGGSSKCSFDFLLEGNKTLSLKTNIGKMVCPPEVGQPNSLTCYQYFKDLISEDHIDKNIFKGMVYEQVGKMIPIYMEHLFDSDYLLRVFLSKGKIPIFKYEIFEKKYGNDFKWETDSFDFSKPNIEDWNESNTLYYKKISIGEFQVHNNRNCYKFRFNFENLIKLIGNYHEGDLMK